MVDISQNCYYKCIIMTFAIVKEVIFFLQTNKLSYVFLCQIVIILTVTKLVYHNTTVLDFVRQDKSE